ncbi:signal peptidase I [Planococcus beigongshangi]|uniref:signal peptidase I n=1 Tax=Planococcus beigongshangi TaxID=2782536 RepID=UPI001EEE978E|nr:signal peptidase I [Planococcus beigongshangi]
MPNEPSQVLIAWMKMIILGAIVILASRQFIYEPVEVHGKSMLPTFEENDRIILMKISKIERFDMIVFEVNNEKNYLKRVIGIPGDVVKMEDDRLYINGVETEEPYLEENRMAAEQMGYQLLTADFPAVTVPTGYYFVLGDNRLNSVDSRILGFIKKDRVMGEVKFRLSPLEHIGPVK